MKLKQMIATGIVLLGLTGCPSSKQDVNDYSPQNYRGVVRDKVNNRFLDIVDEDGDGRADALVYRGIAKFISKDYTSKWIRNNQDTKVMSEEMEREATRTFYSQRNLSVLVESECQNSPENRN